MVYHPRCHVCRRPLGQHAPLRTEKRGDDIFSFCSEACKQDFLENPERYKAEEEE